MMWQSEGISRLGCSHALSSVTDEQPNCRAGAQSANKAAEPLRSPLLPDTAQPAGGLESSSLTNGLHKHHSGSSECITSLPASPGAQSMHGLPLKSPFQAPHNRYLIANRINCNCFFKAQSIWDNVQRHRAKRRLQLGAGEVDAYLFTEGI